MKLRTFVSNHNGVVYKRLMTPLTKTGKVREKSPNSSLKGPNAAKAAKNWRTKVPERRWVYCGEPHILHAASLLRHFKNLGLEEEAELLSRATGNLRAGWHMELGPTKVARSWRTKMPERKEVQRSKFTFGNSPFLEAFSDS